MEKEEYIFESTIFNTSKNESETVSTTNGFKEYYY
jgi:hypothetical protein